MKKHILSYYKDNYKDVPYCSLCGAEGDALFLECAEAISSPTQPNDKDIVGNSIDRRKEHS